MTFFVFFHDHLATIIWTVDINVQAFVLVLLDKYKIHPYFVCLYDIVLSDVVLMVIVMLVVIILRTLDSQGCGNGYSSMSGISQKLNQIHSNTKLILLPQTTHQSIHSLRCCAYIKSSKIKFVEDNHCLGRPANSILLCFF